MIQSYPRYSHIPLRHVLVVKRHEDGIFASVSDGVEFLQQELDELLFALLRHNGQSIDDDEGIQTLFQLDLILRFEIC